MTFSSVSEAEKHADAARENLAATLDQLKDNLSPRQLAGEALAATRARSPGWLLRTLDLARSPSGLGLIGATAAGIAVTIAKQRRRRLDRPSGATWRRQ